MTPIACLVKRFTGLAGLLPRVLEAERASLRIGNTPRRKSTTWPGTSLEWRELHAGADMRASTADLRDVPWLRHPISRPESPKRGPRLADLPVFALMRDVDVLVTEAMPLATARDLFRSREIRRAPVVDGRGRPVGFLSRRDVADAPRAEGSAEDVTVGDVMTCFVFAVPRSASVGRAAALMAYEGVGCCVVTGEGGRVVGMITARDVARRAAMQSEFAGTLGGRRAACD